MPQDPYGEQPSNKSDLLKKQHKQQQDQQALAQTDVFGPQGVPRGGVQGYRPPPTQSEVNRNLTILTEWQHLYLNHKIETRAYAITPDALLNDIPATAADMLFSKVDDYSLSLLGKVLETSYPWLKANTGLDGMFAASYGKALMIPDAALRRRAVHLLDAMVKSSAPMEQPGIPGPGFNPVMNFTFEGQDVQLGLQTQGGNELLVFSKSNQAAGEVGDLLQYLVQNTNPATIRSPGFRGPYMILDAFGLSFDWLQHEVGAPLAEGGGMALKGAGVTLDKVPGGHIARVAFGKAGDVASATFHYGQQAVQTGLTRAAEVTVGTTAGLLNEMTAGFTGQQALNPVDFFRRYTWPDQPGTGIGNAWNDFRGIKPDNPAYQANQELGNFVGQWILLDVVGGVARGAKAGRAGPALPEGEALPLGRFYGRPGYGAKEMYGQIGARVHEFVSDGGPLKRTDQPGEGWLKTGRGNKFLNELDRIITNEPNPTAALQTQMKMPAELAERMGRTTSRAERIRAFLDTVSGKPDTQLMLRQASELRGVDAALERPTPPEPMEQANLLVRKAELERALKYPTPAEPIYQWPKPSLARRVITDSTKAHPALGPLSDFEHALAVAFDPSIHFPHIPGWLNTSRFFDVIGSTKVFNWLRTDAPSDAKTRNADLIKVYFKRAGVPEPFIRRAIQGMEGIVTDEQFFQWAKDVGGILRNESKTIYPRFRDEIGTIWDREASEQHRLEVERKPNIDGVDVNVQTQVIPKTRLDPATGKTQTTSQPSIEAELADHFYLPSVERLVNGSSRIQNMLAWAQERGGGAEKAHDLARMLGAVSPFATAVFKPLILVTRVPALILRTQFEQYLRNTQYGYRGLVSTPRRFDIPLPFGDDPLLVQFGKQYIDRGLALPDDLSTLGTLLRTTYRSGGEKTFREFELWKPSPDGTIKPTADLGAYRDGVVFQMGKLHLSPTGRKIAATNSVDGFVKWLKSDEWDATMARSSFDPILKASDWADEGLTLDQMYRRWGQGLKDYVNQITGGREDLRRAIVTGKWKHKRPPRGETPAIIPGVAPELNDAQYLLSHQLTEAENLLRRSLDSGDEMEIRAALELRDRLTTKLRLEGLKGRGGKSVALADRERFAKELQQAVGDGDYVPPRTVAGLGYYEPSNAAGARSITVSTARRLYRGIGPLSLRSAGKADVALTRGSLYFQVARNEYDRLLSLGWTKREARAHAQTRAAAMTSDMMYDLAARTSAQRFLRNTSYFFPAYQELLTTWLVKIPSQAYWPVGATILYERAHLVHNLMKDLGVIKVDSTGTEIVPIPGVANMLSKLGNIKGLQFLKTLDPKVVQDIVSFKAKGINLIGQGWPSLGTQYKAALDLMAHHNKTIAALDAALSPFGIETTIAPASFNYFWEAMTGDPSPLEFLSPRQQDQFHDLAIDDAAKQAWAEIGPPPKITDFGITDAKTDTPAREKQFRAAADKWREKVGFRAKEIYRAWQFTRGLGATFSLAALHVTDTYREESYKFFNKFMPDKPKYGTPEYGAWKDKVDAWIENYMGDHPNSYAYFTTKSLLGDKVREPLFPTTADNAQFQKYYTGEMKAANLGEFLDKAFYQEARRWHLADVQREMDQIGTDAPTLLANGFTRHEVTDDAVAVWNAWKSQNAFRDIAGEQDGQFRRWALANHVTLTSAATEAKYQAASLLRSLAQSTATGGLRDRDWRKVTGQLVGIWYDEASPNFTPPTDPVTKGIAWYSKNVLSPYLEATGKLYEKAGKLTASGADPGDIYDQIRAINNQWAKKNLRYGGAAYPSPEEVFWGNLNPAEQREKRIGWATRPTSWLTDFQRNKAGYPSNPKADDYFNWKTQRDNEFYSLVQKQGISTSSNAYDDLKNRLLSFEYDEAKKRGLGDFFMLDQATPVERLQAVGMIDNPTFRDAANYAKGLRGYIVGQGFSTKGFAKTADIDNKKASFFLAVEKARQDDPEFNHLLARIGLAIQIHGHPTEHALLYNALFFGGFDDRALPPGLPEYVMGRR